MIGCTPGGIKTASLVYSAGNAFPFKLSTPPYYVTSKKGRAPRAPTDRREWCAGARGFVFVGWRLSDSPRQKNARTHLAGGVAALFIGFTGERPSTRLIKVRPENNNAGISHLPDGIGWPHSGPGDRLSVRRRSRSPGKDVASHKQPYCLGAMAGKPACTPIAGRRRKIPALAAGLASAWSSVSPYSLPEPDAVSDRRIYR